MNNNKEFLKKDIKINLEKSETKTIDMITFVI